jgi:hypothetical protein
VEQEANSILKVLGLTYNVMKKKIQLSTLILKKFVPKIPIISGGGCHLYIQETQLI